MYAIVELGGHQWKVEPGTRLDINRIASSVGDQLPLERVLFASDGKDVQVGCPYVPGAKVICEILEHRLGPKVISYYFRRRENWRKTIGHRQPLTRVVVKDISLSGSSSLDYARDSVTEEQGEKIEKPVIEKAKPSIGRPRKTSSKPRTTNAKEPLGHTR